MADPVEKEKYERLMKAKSKILRNDKILADKNRVYR